MLEISLLGKFEVLRAGLPVAIPSRPAQSLFAFLILNAGTAYRREKLAGLLWPDSPEESARDYLRHALWRIRKALQGASAAAYLQADDLTIAFNPKSDCWLDVEALRTADEAGPIDGLTKALSAYKGELLPGFYDEWVVLEREQIQGVYERKISSLLQLLQSSRRWTEILDWSERWIALGQGPEAAYRYLMSAYAGQGDMGKAMAMYERCVKAMSEYGTEPSEQTMQLLAELKSQPRKESAMPPQREGPAASVPAPKPANLPKPLTGFIGREQELNDIGRLMEQQRLLTLMGPGGVGKTRLAIEAARKLACHFRDGVWWVDLVGLSDPALVPQAVGQATGAPERPERTALEAVLRHLATRESLLVLDNCEHLNSACAQLADQLLSGCPQLKILATSRQALDILGEATWVVPSLSLPAATDGVSVQAALRSESVHLFLGRAALVQPHFELTEQNAGWVAGICRQLDGIPLAIELAAARARMMSVEEIANHINHAFDLLTAGNRTALRRHQTLRATIDWSYDLLLDDERILFRRLAVFAGGFTLGAVEDICSDDLLPKGRLVGVLGQLISKSLVAAQPTASEPETRYTMLETIRQYAVERLEAAQEQTRLRERHLAYFAAFAVRAGRGLTSGEQVLWFARIRQDVENLRLALNWRSPDPSESTPGTSEALRNQYLIIGSMPDFWENGYGSEIVQLLNYLVSLDTGPEPTFEKARALGAGGFLLWSLHNFQEARRRLEESIAIADRLGDRFTLAWSQSCLGWTFDFLGDFDSAQACWMKSLEIAKALGDDGMTIMGQSLSFLGDIPYWRGDLAEARRCYEEGAAYLRALNNGNRLTYPLRRLGYVCVGEGDVAGALTYFAESLELNRQVGHRQGMAACLAAIAAAELAKNDLERAGTLYCWVESELQRIGAPFFFIDTQEYQRGMAKFRASAAPNLLEKCQGKGSAMSLEQAMEFALGSRKYGPAATPGREN